MLKDKQYTDEGLVMLQNRHTREGEYVNDARDFRDEKIFTHGYVHGHIHQHDDHAHIHGHIHNHDHDHHFKNLEREPPFSIESVLNDVDNLPQQQDCNAYDGFDLCQDILCDELDDCFYLKCTKNELKERLSEAYSLGQQVGLSNSAGPQTDKDGFLAHDNTTTAQLEHKGETARAKDKRGTCGIEETKIDDLSFTNHGKNLCDMQMSRTLLFENLINEVHHNFEMTQSSLEKANSPKKVKLDPEIMDTNSNADIHFPHRCHVSMEKYMPSEKNIEELSTGRYRSEHTAHGEHHHSHNSCFHTTVPVNIDSSVNPKKNTDMSDFEFYLHFNNLDTSKASMNYLEEPLARSLTNASNFDNTLFPCKWNNCLRKVCNETVMQHLINQHIGQEYCENKSSPVNGLNLSYQCEWEDCNYINPDLALLIDHLKSHKGGSPVNENPLILTPHSPKTSSMSPPVVWGSQKKQFPADANITNVNIFPRSQDIKDENSSLDQFTCRWEVGLDYLQNPIQCGKNHCSSGDLHQHLLDNHIDHGKSIYHCRWIGCLRHNGKCFPQRQKLLRHVYMHTKHRPCKCNICGALFAVDSMLQQHLRTHSGEKPFTCSICGKEFVTASSLSIHKRVHTGEKPLECKWPGCNKRFSESSNLSKHMKTHTKSYNCGVCNTNSYKKSDYSTHMAFHE